MLIQGSKLSSMQNECLCPDFDSLLCISATFQCLVHVLRILNMGPSAALLASGLLVCLCGGWLDSLWMDVAESSLRALAALVSCASGEGSVYGHHGDGHNGRAAEAAWSRLRVDGRMFLCDLLLELIEYCF